jgi:hypothetical protein
MEAPRRPDGTPKVFFYDREGHHMIHRRPDGSMEALGWKCQHEVQVSSD